GNEHVAYFDDAKIALNVTAGRGYSIDFSYRNWLFYEVFMKHEQLRSAITDGVKPTASKQPLYPLLLSLVFLCFGAKNFFVVFVLHALLSAATSVILFLAFRRVSNLIGIIMGVGAGVYPSFVVHSVTTPE